MGFKEIIQETQTLNKNRLQRLQSFYIIMFGYPAFLTIVALLPFVFRIISSIFLRGAFFPYFFDRRFLEKPNGLNFRNKLRFTNHGENKRRYEISPFLTYAGYPDILF